MMSSVASSSSCSQQQRSLQRERERYQRERQQVTISGGGGVDGNVGGNGVPGELFLPGPTGSSAGSLFGEPIKKHQDDETSKRIKSTLGDFDHVQMYLRYDHKPLIGISTREITRINGNKAKIEQIFSEMKQTFQPLGALEDGESEGSHGTREEEEDDQEEEDEDDEDGDEDKDGDEEEANESDSSSSSGSSSSSSSASNSTSSSTTDDDDDDEEDKDNNNKQSSEIKANDSSGPETNINNKKRKNSSGSSSSSSSASSSNSSSKNLPRSSPPQSEVSTWNLTNFMDKKTTTSTTSVSSSNYVHIESVKVTNDSINDVIDKVARGELGEHALDHGNRNHYQHQKHHHPPPSSEEVPPTKRRKKSNQPSQPQSLQIQHHFSSPTPPPQQLQHLASPQPPPQQQQQTQHLPSPPPPLPPPQQHLPSPPPPPPPQQQQHQASYHHQHHQEITRQQYSQESIYQREKTKTTERAKRELNRNGNITSSDKQVSVPKAPEKLLVSISLVLLKRIPGQSKETTNIINSINSNNIIKKINSNSDNSNSNININSNTSNNSNTNSININLTPNSNLSADDYLKAAKKLKHAADRETDRTVQARKYLEAVLYFILTGNAMEQRSCGDLEKVFCMYKETLSLIRYISGKFAKSRTSTTEEIPTTDHKLTALSFRCQSLLCLKLSRLKEKEIRSNFKLIQSNIDSNNINTKDKPSVTIPSQLFNAMNRQISLLQQLNNAHDLWQQADNLVDKNPSCAAFFATIDNECGSLGLNSSFDDLVRYVTTGLKILE